MKTALEAYGEKLTNKKFFQDFVTTTINSNLTGINSFLDVVSEHFALKTDPNSDQSYVNKAKFENFEADIKKTTYYNIKSLYDRVGGGSRNNKASTPVSAVSKIKDLNDLEFDNLKDISLFYNNVLTTDDQNCFAGTNAKSYDLYQIFSVVDRGNNDIGTKVLANLAYINQNYYTDFKIKENEGAIVGGGETSKSKEQAVVNLTTGSLSGLLSGLAVESGFISQQIPNYLNLNSTLSNLTNNDADLYNVVDSLFGTHTNTALFGEDILQKRNIKFGGLTGLPGYIYQLGSITSRADVVGLSDRNKVKNDYLNSFCLDVGHDNNSEVRVLAENAPEEMTDSNITCFTVDFGRQNQQMFNGVQLDTSEFFDTEESIKTWVDLVNEPNVTPQTKNIFPVLEKRSYTCTVTSLGNATIQPLTYFYLRNVPLFHGTYWITNVTHKIVPNNMVTTFKGVRQPIISKNDVRKQLLSLMRQQKAKMLESIKIFDQIVIQGEPDTNGKLQTVKNSDKTYGDIAQNLKDGTGRIHYFDGKTIIGAYLYSITGSLEVSAANLGIIATLYNTAKAFKSNTTNHAEILKTMPVIAVGLMTYVVNFYTNDTRYADESKTLSLSKLFKESGNGFAINPNCAIGNFLENPTPNGDIKTYDNYVTKMVIPNEIPTDLIGTIKGVDTGLVSGGDYITLSSASTITPPNPIPIRHTNFFVEHILTTYDNGMTAETRFDATYPYDIYDVFNSFDPTNKKTINSIDEAVKLLGVEPETKTAVGGGGNGLTEYTSFQNWCNYIDSTEVAINSDGLTSSSEKTIYDAYWEFALTASNGDYAQIDFNYFIGEKLAPNQLTASPTDLKNAWDKLPKIQKNNLDVAEKAIFYDIGIDVTYAELKADNPTFSFSIDFEIKFPGGYGDKKYDDLTDPDNQLTFWTDYRSMCNSIKIMNDSLVKDKTKAPTAQEMYVKFLGTYKPNISFFSTAIADGNWGEIVNPPLYLNAYYTLDATTEADSVASKSGIDINKQNIYLSKVVGVIDEEFKLWNNGTLLEGNCDDPIVKAAIKKYWSAAKSTFNCESKQPWSAAFISFIMQKSGVEFPFSTSHNTYIIKGRDDKDYAWQTYDVADQKATVRVGDLVCYARDKSINETLSEIVGYESANQPGSLTHCDCVKEVPTGSNGVALQAFTYGGNVSNTVKETIIKLTETGLIDPASNDSNKKYICVIKYQPKGVNSSGGGANNFDPNATGAFTTIQKYPALFEKVLSHESHTYDDHNYYTSGGLRSYFADGEFTKYGGLTKPLSQYTIGDVIQFQSHAQDSVGRLHATGRYQIVGATLKGNLKEAGLTNTDLYSPENQDKLGMVLLGSNTIKYLNKQVDDTQDNLNKAAMEIARTWSSVGVPHPTTWTDDKGNVHNVAFDQSYYGYNGVDRANTRTADVQAALKYYRNGTVAPIVSMSNSNDSNFFTVAGVDLLQLSKEIYNSKTSNGSPDPKSSKFLTQGKVLSINKGYDNPFDQNVYNTNKTSSRVYWAVHDITNDVPIANHQGGTLLYGASVPKVVVAAAAFDNNNGTLPTVDDYKNVIKLLVASYNDGGQDNNVWANVTNLAGGVAGVNAFNAKMGYTMRSARPPNNVSALDMCYFFRDVIRNRFKGAEFIYKLTASCGTSNGRGKKCMPKDVIVGGKTGTVDGKNHNCCWIKTNDNKFYAISVLTSGFSESKIAANIVAQMFRGLYNDYIVK